MIRRPYLPRGIPTLDLRDRIHDMVCLQLHDGSDVTLQYCEAGILLAPERVPLTEWSHYCI
jgi:hypothetical protein